MKKILRLVKRNITFKLIIPNSVEEKIRFLCKNIWSVEWSGVLFYKVSGSFEDNSLIITCVDIYQMDEGSSTYTEYGMSPNVISYMCDHPELLEKGVYQGLIHSHNNMPTFFSSTDTATLQSEGSDMNHFVSLIVNNEGKYTAAITRKYKAEQQVLENFTYSTWEDKKISGEESFESSDEYIEYFYLDIEKPIVFHDEEMLNRIKEIRDNKKNVSSLPITNKNTYSSSPTYKANNYANNPTISQPNIPKQTELPFEDDSTISYNMPYGKVHANAKVVDCIVKQIVTASIIIPNDSTIDIKKWAANMDKLYNKRFKDLSNFETFAVNYIDYLISWTDPLINPSIMNDATELSSILAYDVREELSKLPRNKWINIYESLLDDYIL